MVLDYIKSGNFLRLPEIVVAVQTIKEEETLILAHGFRSLSLYDWMTKLFLSHSKA